MKYFTIEELCRSNDATKYGIDNTPSQRIRENLTALVDNLLDPLREAWGSGIKITSGYRSPALNKKVGGSSTSAHQFGFAVDTKPANGKMLEYQQFVEKWLKQNANVRGWDQLLHEYPKGGVDSWVHLGYKNSKGLQRRQVLTIK